MNALQHLRLLLRYDRALNLRRAVSEVVHHGARVLDAGCGVGLLSFWAAQAGAAEVLGVDYDPVDVAAALAVENGFSDSVRFLQQDLRKLTLQEVDGEFDVILAMIYLNDPRRDEEQTHVAYSLRQRFLAGGGTMIPGAVRYTVRGCEWPGQDALTRAKTLSSRVADLEGRYGFSLKPLSLALAQAPWHDFFPAKGSDGRLQLGSARVLSQEGLFAAVDYGKALAPYPETFEVQIVAPGVLNTLVWTQELWHSGSLLFSNESVSWIDEPRRVEPKSRCTVHLGDRWRQLNLASITDLR